MPRMSKTDESLSTRDLAFPERERDTVADSDTVTDSATAPTSDPVQTPTLGDDDLGADRAADNQPAIQPAESAGGQPAPAASSANNETNGTAADEGALLSTKISGDFQRRWEAIQTQFVDEPRGAVEDADQLVATVMQKLAEGFAQERERLEAQWDQGEEISTEDLRVALRRYRAFFQRLLAA